MVNREKIVARLDAAEAETRRLRDLLQLYDSIEAEEGKGKTPALSTVDTAPVAKPRRNSVPQGRARSLELGKIVRKTFLGLTPEETTDVPTVVKMLEPKYPEIGYDDLSKLVNGIARRLRKDGKLKIEKEGTGRTPNTYKIVS